MIPLISKSVGKKAANRPDDVLNVQIRINKWILAGRLPQLDFLAMDGDCGAKTRKAIGAFQCRFVDIPKIDEKIHPGGETERFLQMNPFDPPVPKVTEQIYVDWLRGVSTKVDDTPYWEKRGMFWFGAGVKAGVATNPVNGQDALVASMYNLEDPANRFILTATTKRAFNLGGGASGGAVAVFITGIYHPKDLNTIQFGGVDWNFALAGKWSSFLKWSSKASQIAALVEASKLKKFASPSAISTAATVVKGSAASTGLVIDDPMPSMVCIDIPFLGGGAEASVYYGITSFSVSNLKLVE